MTLAVWILAAVVMLGGTAWKAYGLGEDHKAAEMRKQIEKAEQDKRDADDRYSAGLQDRAALAAAASAALSRPPPDPRSLVVTLPPAAPGQPATPCTDRSPDYRARYNAIASGGSP